LKFLILLLQQLKYGKKDTLRIRAGWIVSSEGQFFGYQNLDGLKERKKSW